MEKLEEKLDKLCSEIKDLKAIIGEKNNCIEAMQEKMCVMEDQMKVLQERVVYQEQRSRNYCICVSGVRIDPELEKSDGHA